MPQYFGAARARQAEDAYDNALYKAIAQIPTDLIGEALHLVLGCWASPALIE